MSTPKQIFDEMIPNIMELQQANVLATDIRTVGVPTPYFTNMSEAIDYCNKVNTERSDINETKT